MAVENPKNLTVTETKSITLYYIKTVKEKIDNENNSKGNCVFMVMAIRRNSEDV